MIVYDPGQWSIWFAFSLKGSVFPKAVMIATPCTLISIILQILFKRHATMFDWIINGGDKAADMLGGFTFILGFLVVFRSSQAYSRWWEGGTLLQQLRGEWFNSYSCLLAFCNAAKDKTADVSKFQHQLLRMFSLLYGCALEQVCTLPDKRFELVALDGLNADSISYLNDTPDRCEVVLQWIQRLIVESDAAGTLKIAPPILSRVFNELGNGIVNLNNARKITEFPIPFPLAQMITVMLLFHAIVTTVMCAAMLDTWFFSGLITFVVITAFWSINYIAVELEMPFGGDANDLPLHFMQQDYNNSLRTLMDRRAQVVPLFAFSPERHGKMETLDWDFADLMTSLGTADSWAPTAAARSEHVPPNAVAAAPQSSPPPPQALAPVPVAPPPALTVHPPTAPPPAMIPPVAAIHSPQVRQALEVIHATIAGIEVGTTHGGPGGQPHGGNGATSSCVGSGGGPIGGKFGQDKEMESKRKMSVRDEDNELVRVSMRIEDHLARIEHELEAIASGCARVGPRPSRMSAARETSEQQLPFLSCTR